MSFDYQPNEFLDPLIHASSYIDRFEPERREYGILVAALVEMGQRVGMWRRRNFVMSDIPVEMLKDGLLDCGDDKELGKGYNLSSKGLERLVEKGLLKPTSSSLQDASD